MMHSFRSSEIVVNYVRVMTNLVELDQCTDEMRLITLGAGLLATLGHGIEPSARN